MNMAIGNRKIGTDDLPKYTVKDWEQWEGKWELIEGIPYAMSPMPSIKHQRINGRLYRQFEEKLEQSYPTCDVFLPVNFKIDKHNVIHPDLLIVCDRNDDEMYITTIPELAVEIISKSSKKQDTITKPKIYQSVGIRYYVLIDPIKETVKIFELRDSEYKLVKEVTIEEYEFKLGKCTVNFEFKKMWA